MPIACRSRKSLAALMAAACVIAAPGPYAYRAWGAAFSQRSGSLRPVASTRTGVRPAVRPLTRPQSASLRRLEPLGIRPIGQRSAPVLSAGADVNLPPAPSTEGAEPAALDSSRDETTQPGNSLTQLASVQTTALQVPESLGVKYDLGPSAKRSPVQAAAHAADSTPAIGGSSLIKDAALQPSSSAAPVKTPAGVVPAAPAPTSAASMTNRQALKIALFAGAAAFTGVAAAAAMNLLPFPVESLFNWTQAIPTVEPASTKPDLWRAWVPIAGIGLITVLESFRRVREPIESRAKHFVRNFGLTMFNGMIMYLTMSNILAIFGAFLQSHGIGLLNLLAGAGMMPLWLNIGLSLVFFDFVTYVIHRAMHKKFFLWRFHQIHHSDLDVDATTGARIHVGEAFLSVFFKMAAAVVWGPAAIAVAIHETVLFLGALFHHANVRMPAWLEKPLRQVIVTPFLHQIHHSNKFQQHDSNYADTFSIWDRLFGTYQEPGPENAKIVYGIATQKKLENLKFIDLLLLPNFAWMKRLKEWLKAPAAGRQAR